MKIALKGAKNVRDFSEYGIEGYIRSANLSGLTPIDVAILTGRHNLKTVIDLRTTQEVSEKPDVKMQGVKYIHIPIFDEEMPGISHEITADAQTLRGKLERAVPDMPTLYRELVTDEQYVFKFKQVMDIICDPQREGAVLWHCSEGKDRCGIVSAIFLFSKGVSEDIVMKDYLKSKKSCRGAMKYYFLVWLADKDRKFAARVRDAFTVKKEYLQPVMSEIKQLGELYKAK